MEALDLVVLGKRLERIGLAAMRGREGGPPEPTGKSLVMRDVLAHPGSSISDIVARTGLPQSYVSESVAALRADGTVRTQADPTDGRRTLVHMSDEHRRRVAGRGAVAVDAELGAALAEDGPDLTEVLSMLAALADALGPVAPGAVMRQLRGHVSEDGQ